MNNAGRLVSGWGEGGGGGRKTAEGGGVVGQGTHGVLLAGLFQGAETGWAVSEEREMSGLGLFL